MGRWQIWAIMAVLWGVITVMNLTDGRPASVVLLGIGATVLFAALAVSTCVLRGRGERGERILHVINLAALVLCIVLFLAVLVTVFVH